MTWAPEALARWPNGPDLFGRLILLLAFGVAPLRLSAELLRDPGFEAEQSGWRLFVPGEGGSATGKFELREGAARSGKRDAALSSEKNARLGIYAQPRFIMVTAGERYRLSAWVKAAPDFVATEKTPGFVLRATLFTGRGKDHPEGHVFVGLRGVTRRDPETLAGTVVPLEWTKVEGVCEIPKGAAKMAVFAFVWQGKGTLYLDDLSVEKIVE